MHKAFQKSVIHKHDVHVAVFSCVLRSRPTIGYLSNSWDSCTNVLFSCFERIKWR